MKSLEILAILSIASSFLENVSDCRRLPKRSALEDEEWRAATDEAESEEGLSAEEIMNMKLPTQTTDDDETTDEIISQAGTEKGAAISAAQHGEVNFGMDMNMDPGQFAEEYEKNGDGDSSARMASNNERLAGTGKHSEKYRWPQGIIPYKIRKNDYSEKDKKMIYAGMKMWMEVTCIKFVKAGSPEAKSTGHEHFIWIGNGEGCYTRMGYRNGKKHEVILRRSKGSRTGIGCMTPDTVAHELGHVIGLQHEQNRKDRDKYVQVLFENIKDDMHSQFAYGRETSRFDTPYDYCSIMHYGPRYFAKDEDKRRAERSLFSMVPMDLDYISVIGRSSEHGISYYDATIVNKMYKCRVTVPPKPCPGRPCTDRFSASACEKLEVQLSGQPIGKNYVGKNERFHDQQ